MKVTFDLFSCVIETLCVPNLEFQLINPTTQVALFALCLGQCSSQRNISWNVYQGSINTSSNIPQWTLFNQINIWRDLWFFGRSFYSTCWRNKFAESSLLGTNTSNFTSSNRLFLSNPQIHLWRFEVVYSFPTAISSSALNFLINQPPSNGSCSIGPPNGTTTSTFNVSCPNWFDQDDIKDYSLYRTSKSNRSEAKIRICVVLVWSSVPSERTMIAFSSVFTFQVQLPNGNDPAFSLSLVIYVRDTRDCITEWNLTSIVVRSDSAALDALLNQLADPSSGSTNNPLTELLVKGNANTVGQVISSVSQQFNQKNKQNLQDAVSSNLVFRRRTRINRSI